MEATSGVNGGKRGAGRGNIGLPAGQPRYDAGHTGVDGLERTLTAANVGGLAYGRPA